MARIALATAACGACPPQVIPRWSRRTRSPVQRTFRAARKLTRSTTDKHVWGVAGGLGRYFGIDPVHLPRGVRGGDARQRHRPDRLHRAAAAPADRRRRAAVDGGPLAGHHDRRHRRAVRSSRVSTLLGAGLPRSARACSSSRRAACSALGGLPRASAGRVREDPAKAIARATLALLALVAALGAATGVGLIAAIGGGVAVAVIAIVAGPRPDRRRACSAGRDGSSFP